jgi:hypothetical protein
MQEKELIARFSINECLYSVECPGCHIVYMNGYQPRGDLEFLAETMIGDQIIIFNKDFWEEHIKLPSPLPTVYYELHWTNKRDGVIHNKKGSSYVLPYYHRLFCAQFETEEEMNNYTSGWCSGGIGFRSYRVTDERIYQVLEENGRWRPYRRNGILLYSHLYDHLHYCMREEEIRKYIYL